MGIRQQEEKLQLLSCKLEATYDQSYKLVAVSNAAVCFSSSSSRWHQV